MSNWLLTFGFDSLHLKVLSVSVSVCLLFLTASWVSLPVWIMLFHLCKGKTIIRMLSVLAFLYQAIYAQRVSLAIKVDSWDEFGR